MFSLLKIHTFLSFLYVATSLLFPKFEKITLFLMVVHPLPAIPFLCKLPARWIHLNLSSLCTIGWCWIYIVFPSALSIVWGITILHYLYRCFKLKDFKQKAIRVKDLRYLLVPTYVNGTIACTIFAEAGKFMVDTNKKAIALALCSNLAIFGTILAKRQLSNPNLFNWYNCIITLTTFTYLICN